MRVSGGWTLAVLLAVGAGAAASTARAQSGDAVVAQRGDVTVTAADVQQLVAMASPAERQAWARDPALLDQKVRELVLQRALLRAAQQAGWDRQPAVLYRAELAREAAIADSYLAAQAPVPPDFPSDAQLHQAYELNKEKFQVPMQYHLAQIVLPVPPGAADADMQQKAAAIRQEAAAGSDFALLAKQQSTDAGSATQGGELGWRREDVLPPQIREALEGMQPGQVSQPLRLPDGWHILKLLGTRPAGIATFEEARDVLVRAMRQQQALHNQRDYLADLIKSQPVAVDAKAVAQAAAAP